MRTQRLLKRASIGCLLLIACGDSGSPTRDGGPSSDSSDSGQPGHLLGDDGDASARPGDGGDGDGDASTEVIPVAGNPDGKCSDPLPPEAQAVDTSHPTTVVGTGTPASCTADELAAAIATGGIITFDCGAAPATIPVTSTLNLRTDTDTVIDGGNKITLDGGGKVRILSWNHDNYLVNTHKLTLQHLVLAHGKATGTELIAPHDDVPMCSEGYVDGQGGALFMQDGALRAIDVTFLNNQAAQLGPDTGGGALYLNGCLDPIYIVSCTFKGNSASNGGAMGTLNGANFIYNSLFDGNTATGMGGNDNQPSQCPYVNSYTQQNQVGSGGNGGAICIDGGYSDQSSMTPFNVTICGTKITNSQAGAFQRFADVPQHFGPELGLEERRPADLEQRRRARSDRLGPRALTDGARPRRLRERPTIPHRGPGSC
jgi:hypothetical protein